MWKKGIASVVAGGILVFTGLMATKVRPYLQNFNQEINFLTTKPKAILGHDDFFWAFYTHITSSTWVMALGVLQFMPWLFRKKHLHRWLGKVYTLSILALAAPSGLVLAWYANGGLPAQVGFAMQCLVWWFSTYWAWQQAIEKNWLQHLNMMILSYAITLAAMSLRLESYLLFYFFHTKPIETYLTVTWLSWVGNIFVAYLLIISKLPRYILALYGFNQSIRP